MSLRAAVRGVALAALLLCPLGSRAATDEYQVKAVFLFNFGQFVEWPKSVFDTPQAPFVICVIGEDPFGKTLDDVVRGETIGTRSPVVRRLRSAVEAEGCHILFVGRGEAARLEQSLAAVRGRSVLTVTDVEGAEKQGAMIVLYNDRNRIRMRINLGVAKASQLVISSKLLRPADVIGAETG